MESSSFPWILGLSPSSLPEIISPPAVTKATASLGALRAQISIPGMKVKAMQGMVAVHSFSHSSASWTIETFMCEVFPCSFSHFFPVSFVYVMLDPAQSNFTSSNMMRVYLPAASQIRLSEVSPSLKFPLLIASHPMSSHFPFSPPNFITAQC